MDSQVGEEVIEIIRMNPTMKRHLELEIRTLQNAPMMTTQRFCRMYKSSKV
jgi:hypothetical protein